MPNGCCHPSSEALARPPISSKLVVVPAEGELRGQAELDLVDAVAAAGEDAARAVVALDARDADRERALEAEG